MRQNVEKFYRVLERKVVTIKELLSTKNSAKLFTIEN